MSGFQRKGTVSKSSGPVHVNSYALRGVPIKYTPPFFLPDLLILPHSWRQPQLPSDDLFRYDYSKERQVLEQARIRTLSFAAEAEARERREEEEEKQRRREAAAAAERAKVSTSTAELPPPLIPFPSSTILTPTQANTTPSNNATNDSGAPPNKASAAGKSGGILVKDSRDVLKPLGEMSLSEFEGDNFNPFDSASLQAINDMEVLQSISLAPAPRPNVNTYAASVNHLPSPVGSEARPIPAQTSNIGPANTANSGPLAQSAPVQFVGSSPLPPVRPRTQPALAQNSTTPSAAVLGTSPHQQLVHPHPPPPTSISAHPHPSLPTLPVLPPIGSSVTHSFSEPTNTTTPPSSSVLPPPVTQGTPTNPQQPTPSAFMSQGTPTALSSSSSPISSPHTAITSTAPTNHPNTQLTLSPYPSLPQFPNGTVATLSQPTAAVGEGVGVGGEGGGVGTLVNLGGGDEQMSTPPSGAVPTPPSQQQTLPPAKPPVPKPRTIKTALVTGQSVPNSAHLPYPSGSAPLPRPPAVPPKPPANQSTIQARASNLLATLSQGQPAVSRPGLGVAVLPPIPTPSSSSSTTTSTTSTHQPPQRGHSSPSIPPSVPPSHPPSYPTPPQLPPPYHQPAPSDRSASPPPPYYPSSVPLHPDQRRFSQPVTLPSHQHIPSHFTLPDPQSSLSADERSEVMSIAGMGFQAPRVARAVRRFKSDRTKVVDFLILVGGMEEGSASEGDSAEVALTVCDENEDKAKRYLQKVRYYKESGFSEKSIHEAYEKADKDWERALDILTQNTTTD